MQNDSRLKRDVTVFSCLVSVCVLASESGKGGREAVLQSQRRGLGFSQNLRSGAGECFRMEAVESLQTTGSILWRGQASDPERGCDQVTCCITSPAGSRGWRPGW